MIPDIDFSEVRSALSEQHILDFRRHVYEIYKRFYRPLPWRYVEDPYAVFVSEVMLQQTQVARVLEKYMLFLQEFPTVDALAGAPLQSVLKVWSGLGYNRRALMLQQAAQRIVVEHGSIVPADREALDALPGIGEHTAGSIAAFAFGQPTIFVETNIRTVFLHSFFRESKEVVDAALVPLIERTLDRADPRSWYYALMDYGVLLKKAYPNPSRRSAHHVVQSRFEGSDRKIRGALLREITRAGHLSLAACVEHVAEDSIRVQRILAGLVKDGFLVQQDDLYTIKEKASVGTSAETNSSGADSIETCFK